MPNSLAGFNRRPRAEAEAELLACCASRAFAAAVAVRRPYTGRERLAETAEAAVRALEWPDVLEALAAHPRIGERAPGDARESRWSRQEQAGAGEGGAGLREALADGNRAYEERFGHVYLVCATGLSGAELLARLRARLGNDEETERGVVRDELAKITRLRLGKLMEEEGR
ncbi:2-oxo-4-hydroxy-4-carboxy-5-ureidoimidazoline decarboxylase [Nonomuraea spiralis]|uniref:2-oxo-4-hydroxy-4-carboxy-5-ureidoimidazoline decarboxylase n=1 Tax=Nonomuraea TaxID=83681 RepID=UPI000F7926F2|nr:2-oxo-4-hydroxy-4-carboxy-5-ureidoimidazoline decarboxylase [Nonomuraea sp. WAC 01424]RSN15962.1 2-oxo-4-hydroxy-4-carboxy-5-ureidoimidazoline decarboxylase [Nonomuraea sp. WAC 01424]